MRDLYDGEVGLPADPWRKTNEFWAPMAMIKAAPDRNPAMKLEVIGSGCG